LWSGFLPLYQSVGVRPSKVSRGPLPTVKRLIRPRSHFRRSFWSKRYRGSDAYSSLVVTASGIWSRYMHRGSAPDAFFFFLISPSFVEWKCGSLVVSPLKQTTGSRFLAGEIPDLPGMRSPTHVLPLLNPSVRPYFIPFQCRRLLPPPSFQTGSDL